LDNLADIVLPGIMEAITLIAGLAFQKTDFIHNSL
jgi:hypothetical protein